MWVDKQLSSNTNVLTHKCCLLYLIIYNLFVSDFLFLLKMEFELWYMHGTHKKIYWDFKFN